MNSKASAKHDRLCYNPGLQIQLEVTDSAFTGSGEKADPSGEAVQRTL